MTPEMRAGVEALITEWQARLGLGEWSIRLSDDPPDENCRANSDTWIVKLGVAIRVAEDAPEEVWPELVIHELLHVVLSPIVDGVVETVFAEYLSPVTRRTTGADLDREVEQVIARLTKTLTGKMVQCWKQDDVLSRTFKVEV